MSLSPGGSKLVHGTEWVLSENLWKEWGRARRSKKSKDLVMEIRKEIEKALSPGNKKLSLER